MSLEGYFAVQMICREMERIGYDPEDVFRGVNYLVKRELILADNFNLKAVTFNESVKIQASGFIHLRILVERIEYLFGCVATTPITDSSVATKLARIVMKEAEHGIVGFFEKVSTVEELYKFLKGEFNRLRVPNPFFDPRSSGAQYVLDAVGREIDRARHRSVPLGGANQLDLP